MSIPPDIPAWADVKIYSNAGLYTWTKPPWAKMVYYNIMHAGNGGGGGFSRTSGQGGGGAGGGEGNGLYGINPAALFPNTLVIRVGKGGTGGAAGTAGSAAQSTTANWGSIWGSMRLWDGQIGGVGNPGTVSAGGSPSTSNSSNNSSRVGNFGISLSNGTQAFGQGGSASGSTTLDTCEPNQTQHGGAGGAGVSSTNFAGRGGGYENQVAQGGDISENNLTTRFVRGGHGASVTLKGNGISTARSNANGTATVTFETGETVIIGIGTAFGYPDRTYVSSVTDGTHTYQAISPFVAPPFGGEGGIQLYKADNVTAGTYNIITSITENGVLINTECVAWYRYDGLSSGPVLATATSGQSGTGGLTTNGITCGPLSSTATPCLLFAATNGQNSYSFQQRVEPGSSINRFIQPTNRSASGNRISAGDSLITTTDSVTAQFTVFDIYTNRTTAAVLIGVKTNQLEPKAGTGMDGDIYWLPDTIIPFMRGGGGGGSSHFTEGGDGGRGGPCSSGGGGGAGNPGGRGGDGGDGMCIIACW